MQFQKDLSYLGWDEVKKRQLQRLPLVDEWIKLVGMKEGITILDIGPVPGVFTLRYADAVGTTGRVTALDKSREALTYLAREFYHYQINSVEIMMGDAEEVNFDGIRAFDIIMLTDILHHAVTPERILENIYLHFNKSEGHILISEFDPDSSGEFGPPLQARLCEKYLSHLLRKIGFTVIASGKQNFEHYYLFVGR